MDHLDLAIAKDITRTESALKAFSEKMFENKTVLTALVPNKYAALPVERNNLWYRLLGHPN